MDPMFADTCYQEMCDAMKEVDRLLALARERAKSLHEWIGEGGNFPSQDSPEEVCTTIDQVLMRTAEPDEE